MKKITTFFLLGSFMLSNCKSSRQIASKGEFTQRERTSINTGWKFMRYNAEADKLIYDVRPEVTDRNDNVVADSKPTEAEAVASSDNILKKWILPSANDFIKDPAKRYQRPGGKPGELRVITYRNGQLWATDTVRTAGNAAQLQLVADRSTIKADGQDLSFITVCVLDDKGLPAPCADNNIQFEISGPGEIVATDNGDPADMIAFPSKERKAYSGLALVIVRTNAGSKGSITVTATSDGLLAARVVITSL